MKFRAMMLAFVLGAATIGTARPDVIVATRYQFKATHNGGPTDHLHATYIGSVDTDKWEQATASSLVHPNDERWWHWKIQSHITRLIQFVDDQGVEGTSDVVPPAEVWISTTIYGQAHGDCDSATPHFEADYITAVSGLTGDFNKVVNGDTLGAQKAIRANVPDASYVEFEY
jgi:hypothetical protein